MQWPAKLPKGIISDAMVSGMDILPTSIDAIKGNKIPGQQIDGISLLTSYTAEKMDMIIYFGAEGLHALCGTKSGN